MTDDTTTALKVLMQQVQALTEKVEAQDKIIASTKAHNDRLLDKVMDDKRASTHTPEKIAEMALAGFVPGDDGNWYLEGTRPAHTLTRAEARDPQRYRAAKVAAEKAGATLQIVDPDQPEDPHRRARPEIAETKTTVIKDEDHRVAYVRRDVMADPQQYKRLRADGYMVQAWGQPGDLPEHIQLKFAALEKANDA